MSGQKSSSTEAISLDKQLHQDRLNKGGGGQAGASNESGL